MRLIDEIHRQLQKKQMLLHPFYRDWMQGLLSKEQLQAYSEQYIPFVDSFPRFVSATHSLCESPDARKLLLENLMDEEGMGNSPAHPNLWRDFVTGVGADRNKTVRAEEAGRRLEKVFFDLCTSSYEEGLCALYAYESQIPEIAEAKIRGLAQHYGISDDKTTEFFALHQEADVYHSKACERLIGEIAPEKFEVSVKAAQKASQALWDFLSEVHH